VIIDNFRGVFKLFYTPNQIINKVNNLISADFEIGGVVNVRGEVSGFKVHGAHAYFALKDEVSSLKCAYFFIPEDFKTQLKDGILVDVYGNLKIYEARGDFQLYVKRIQILNKAGLLQIEFENLKNKLIKECIIPKPQDQRKKIPDFPNSIGIIASKTSAAYRDVLKTLYLRYPIANLKLFHTSVQGNFAHVEILKALESADNDKCEVVLLVRGGGTIEDLWCFNNEEVVRRIRKMSKPIIVGVGHEIDHTLSEYAADYAASTPTAAAMHCSINIYDSLKNLQGVLINKKYLINQKINLVIVQMRNLQRNIDAVHPRNKISQIQKDYFKKVFDLKRIINNLIQTNLEKSNYYFQHLQALNPQNLLIKGYVLAYKNGKLIKTVSDLSVDENLKISFHDGNVHAKTTSIEKNLKSQ